MKKLSDSEFIIMKVLWRHDKPFSSSQILECVKGQLDWKLAGLMTALARMGEKGYVYCDRTTRTNYYSASVSEEKYKENEGRSILEKLYDNSATGLIASLYHGGRLSQKEIRELRQYLDSLEENEEEKG